MKYIISENRLESIIRNWLSDFDWEIMDSGDLTVFGNGVGIFSTFGDHLSVSPAFLEKMNGLFGEGSGDFLVDWFNEYFEPETQIVTWDISDFWDSIEDEE